VKRKPKHYPIAIFKKPLPQNIHYRTNSESLFTDQFYNLLVATMGTSEAFSMMSGYKQRALETKLKSSLIEQLESCC
jgi:hypothetical protein